MHIFQTFHHHAKIFHGLNTLYHLSSPVELVHVTVSERVKIHGPMVDRFRSFSGMVNVQHADSVEGAGLPASAAIFSAFESPEA